MTGGYSSENSAITEVLKHINDEKWTILKYGNLPSKYHRYRSGVRLATVENNVFAFGD